MARIEWQDKLSVGISELDNQHKELLRIYNNLHESLMNDTVEETFNTKLNTLKGLCSYVGYHFSTEEAFLNKIGYPERTAHCRYHQEFTDKIQAFRTDLEQQKIVLGTSLIKVLHNWIVEHITGEDKKYADYHRQIGSKAPLPAGH